MKTMAHNLKLVFLLTISEHIHAQTCYENIPRTAPDNRYELVVGSGGSEVLDKQTKLVWLRCSFGQRWSGTTCVGTASTHDWVDALKQAKNYGNNYRLPNIKELESLVEVSCKSSSINENMFPTTAGFYWSSSPMKFNGLEAWYISFLYGASSGYSIEKSNKLFIRLVRDQ